MSSTDEMSSDESKGRDIVLYVGGGSMLGVFGAGVVTALEEMDIYPRIKAVYGASAGALDAAYFLAHQSVLGSSIYYDNLTKDFIYPKNLIPGVLQRMWSGWVRRIPREKILSPVDIEYVFKIVKEKKSLNIEKIFETGINFYIEVFNMKTGETEWRKPTRNNIWMLLKASASAVPYWFPSDLMDQEGLIDGAIDDPTGVEYLLEQHPDKKIILIINEPVRRGVRHKIKNFLEAIVTKAMYNNVAYQSFLRRERVLREGIEKARPEKRILLVHVPKDSPTTPATTNRTKLLKTYEMGKQAARQIKGFL